MRSAPAWGVALLRVVLGAIYIMHGWLALALTGPVTTAQTVMKTGVGEAAASAFAWYIVVAHVVGGLMLVIGFWTMLAALAQVPIMAGALFRIHLAQGFYLHPVAAEGGQAFVAGYEFALLTLAATLAIALTGPGRLSIDEARRRGPRRLRMP